MSNLESARFCLIFRKEALGDDVSVVLQEVLPNVIDNGVVLEVLLVEVESPLSFVKYFVPFLDPDTVQLTREWGSTRDWSRIPDGRPSWLMSLRTERLSR